jgi:DNA repair protein RecN (Recombination protein N)
LCDLETREAQLAELLAAAARDLSAKRTLAAERLTSAVETELADLQLGGTRFVVSLSPLDEPDTSGGDRVEFLIATDPGEEPRPMARIASGGELARIALALKTILSRAETRPTLIFDEVDVGVGGRTAPVVGQKLWSVASAGHQVLCVTHMPQVAAFADQHYLVLKDRTARVSQLDDPARIEELAAMLSGQPSASALESARELLSRAGAFKRGVEAPSS